MTDCLSVSGVGWAPKRAGGRLRNIFRASASLEGHCRRYCELNAEKNFPEKSPKAPKVPLSHDIVPTAAICVQHWGVGNFEAVF